MALDRMTDLTRTRQAMLEGIARRNACELALLLFIDRDASSTSLLTAYVFSRKHDLAPGLFDRAHRFACAADNIPHDVLIYEAELFVDALALPQSFSSVPFSYHVLSTDCSPFDVDCPVGETRPIGVLVLAGAGAAEEMPETELERLAAAVSVGRCHRFISTVLRTQRDLAEPSDTLDDSIRETSYLFGRELGARGFRYLNKINDPLWSEHPLHKPEVEQGAEEEFPSASLHRGGESTALVHGTCLAWRSGEGERLDIMLSQPSYRITSRAFCRADRIARSLAAERCASIRVSFHGKRDPGYLQSRFSETDQRIAEAVYGNLQNFAELKLADESYEKVFSILHGQSLTLNGSPRAFLATLRKLSSIIDNVHVVSVDLMDHEIDLQCETADPFKPLRKSYLERLQRKYLGKFYYGGKPPDYNNLLIGMDASAGQFLLEIHTPREFGNSKLYLISFSEPFLAQPTFTALTNLFGELFTRMKEEDFRQARSNNLTETRHSVIHHFRAAHEAIDLIKSNFDLGLRNRSYWLSLQEDPVFGESVDWAYWSLNQASVLLENGRFLSEIDPKTIARRPMNILEIIRDCQRVLRIDARRKGLKMMQKVRGEPPSVMTGDEVLMRVAILNLLDNAIKYSLNNGSVRWELIFKPLGYEFRVSNRGDPISAERFQLLLQVGYRGKQRDHLNLRPGTGLGLPVARRILRAHSEHCDLKLESEKHSEDLGGATNTFYFEMPYLTGLSNLSGSDRGN